MTNDDTNLVQRLRWRFKETSWDEYLEAADRIDTLTAENARLREALRVGLNEANEKALEAARHAYFAANTDGMSALKAAISAYLKVLDDRCPICGTYRAPPDGLEGDVGELVACLREEAAVYGNAVAQQALDTLLSQQREIERLRQLMRRGVADGQEN